MKIDPALWTSLESENHYVDGVVRRRVLADSPHDVFIAVVLPGRHRQLIFVSSSTELLSWRLDESQVVKPEVVQVAGSTEYELRFVLTDPDAAGVFTAFCNDLLVQLSELKNRDAGARIVYERFRLWRRLLGNASKLGLNRLQQQGLFGELELLREVIPHAGCGIGVDAWHGPMGDTTDFVLGGIGIEVKTASSKAPEIVRISSEKQLSIVGLSSIFLCVYVLVAREEGTGKSLPDAVQDLRNAITGFARVEFENRLIQAGYSDEHCAMYESTKYSVLERKMFAVNEGFPSIVQEELPSGVGNVSYSLSLDACTSFRTTNDLSLLLNMADQL